KLNSIVLCFLSLLFVSVLSIIAPFLIGQSIDILNESKNFDVFIYIIIVIIFVYIIKYTVSIITNNVLIKINFQFTSELRIKLMEKIVDLPMLYLSKKEKGYLLSRLDECTELESIFSSDSLNSLCQVLTAILALLMMFVLNCRLALMALLIVPLVYFISHKSHKRISANITKSFEANGELSADSYEILNGVEDFKNLGMKFNGFDSFYDSVNLLVRTKIMLNKALIKFEEHVDLICNLGALLVLLISGFFIIKNEITIGLYTSFSLYLSIVIGGILSIGGIQITLQPAAKSMQRINEIFDEKSERQNGVKIIGKIHEMRFEKVSFQYGDCHFILQNFNMTFCKGDKVQIKGKNGSGKSTIAKLLLALYEPNCGTIYINGVDSLLISCEEIRSHIGIVSQNIFTFKGTVLENILCGQHKKGKTEVLELIDRLELNDYFNRLPNHIDTDIYQNLTGISGGQMQMIAIVRALLSGKEIIVMDEPFANLDTDIRQILGNLLLRWHYSDILIVISHDELDPEIFNKTIELM
ncbi:MAG: ABC transporter ATP-binding protein, partial [Acholeplasma sp.]|nr:ABC transporter ATP-binding protein [Acholeplasma sp.]